LPPGADNGDAKADVAFTFTFSEFEHGRQTGMAWYAAGHRARWPEPAGQAAARQVLPDILRYDRTKPAAYPNGRSLTDNVCSPHFPG
jgi:hypothetical protein